MALDNANIDNTFFSKTYSTPSELFFSMNSYTLHFMQGYSNSTPSEFFDL